jgi:uncharacterized protein (TIGR02186 family)
LAVSARWAAIAALVAAGLLSPRQACAQAPLIADISSREIAITTGFAGAEVLLFGAIEGRGDVVVVVRGPRQPVVVRHKDRVAGVWVNAEARTFVGLPQYYRVAATRPLDQIAPHAVLQRYEIGEQNLDFALAPGEPTAHLERFRAALLREKTAETLFGGDTGTVYVIGGRLFRTTVSFPSSVPTGLYQVEMFLFRDGRLVSRRTTPLVVRKVGLEAEIYGYAHDQAVNYGLIAIAVALMAGWLAGVAFRRH